MTDFYPIVFNKKDIYQDIILKCSLDLFKDLKELYEVNIDDYDYVTIGVELIFGWNLWLFLIGTRKQK